MPEGDTIHRVAERLRQVLLGRQVTRFEAPRLVPPFPALGSEVDRVEARGKHLLVWFSDGLVLHTHLRMTGSWQVHRTAAPWRGRKTELRALVAVPDAVAVCVRAPVVEILDDRAVERHPVLRRLGPDLTTETPDIERALARMSRIADPGSAVIEVLLDQRVASGVGNIYASELCFLAGIDPRSPLHAVDQDRRRSLLEAANRLLRGNLTTTRRTTVPGARDGSLWVYTRQGRPCRRCGTAVESGRVGAQARPAYWCPNCQPPHR